MAGEQRLQGCAGVCRVDPYTETRDYVQAILRNREMYRALYPVR
jgi:soluble lytic murein transglycosylase-like protein